MSDSGQLVGIVGLPDGACIDGHRPTKPEGKCCALRRTVNRLTCFTPLGTIVRMKGRLTDGAQQLSLPFIACKNLSITHTAVNRSGIYTGDRYLLSLREVRL